MNTFPEGICPLCSQVYLRTRLYLHIATEHERVRKRTIHVIKAYHHGWKAEDGACEPCWKSFREAGCTLNLLKQVKPKRQGYDWQRPEAASEEGTAAIERLIAL